jgi:hypothetical protein
LCFILFAATISLTAQHSNGADSAQMDKRKKKAIYSSARKASIMSAIVPGLGQVYNRKYWKVPVIYAGMAAFGYIFKVNNEQYRYYRKNLIAENDGKPETINQTRYSSEQLKTQKDQYQKSRDLGIIGIGAFYLLNIIDANVDAHLKTFDVSDDLSIRLTPFNIFYPKSNNFGTAHGLSVKLIF